MQDDLDKALEVLMNGGTILYPTDTLWGIGCDATNAKAIGKVHKIKRRTPQKPMILLAENVDMLRRYVEKVPEIAIELMESYKSPITIVYEKARNLPKNLIPYDGTIAIRIPRNDFCLQLLNRLGKPITSTSANISGDPSPVSFSKINPEIKKAVDYICTTAQLVVNTPKPSTVIKVSEDGQMQIIRS
ncbi:MAG: L-threonylcarbamoyladenylate synthase [Bacteroidota bacterium]